MATVAALRGAVRERLRSRDYEAVLGLAGSERKLVRAVISLLYEREELIRWRAVTMVGRMAAAEPEMVRPLIGRFVWWMNDESGGIGWSSAPALAEIGRMAPTMLRDTVRVVIHYRAERILFPGVLWAIGRLAKTYRRETEEAVPDLLGFLADDDGTLRGLAAWALGEIKNPRALDGLTARLKDSRRVTIYEEGDLAVKKVGTVAAEAMEKISAR
jgi:HEAT repeat protein